ncbi:MAG: DRTGG domain-containing protein [Acidimicrobiia bacterium]|nr:DRTGG domain-containing protein [Acidimicrobiia bacterium]
MQLSEVIDRLGLEVRSGHDRLAREVTGGYVSDLISDVLAHAGEGAVWVTLQRHQNIVAAASMKELAGIVLVSGREPEDETLAKARLENIPLLVSRLPAFELVGRLWDLGIGRQAATSAATRPLARTQ